MIPICFSISVCHRHSDIVCCLHSQGMTKQAIKSLLSGTVTDTTALLSRTHMCCMAVVSEVGASVYSVSALADAEYPGAS